MTAAQRRGVVSAILIDDNAHALLQLRDDKPEIYAPGHWCLFGGGVEDDETPLQALVREIGEELAIIIDPAETMLFREFEWDVGGTPHTLYGYFVHIGTRGDAAVLGEGQAIGRFALDELAPQLALGWIDGRPVVREDCRLLTEYLTNQSARSGQTHHIAVAIVTDGNSRLLLQLRDDSPHITHPGHWGLFGGSVEAFETPREAIARELEEELAIRADLGEFEAFEQVDLPGRSYHIFAIDVGARGDAAVLGEGQALGRFAMPEIATALPGWMLGGRPILPWAVAPLARFLARYLV